MARALRTSTAHALRIADEKGLHTIAFPAIGTGIGGFPLWNAQRSCCMKSPTLEDPTTLEKIYFVFVDAMSLSAFEKC